MTNQELQQHSIFKQQKYLIVKNFLDPIFSETIYEYLKFSTQLSILRNEKLQKSLTVPECVCQKSNDLFLDAVLKTHKLKVESITGLNLYPTYSMARIYTNENKLIRHIDRPACEISVTIKLSDTKNYNYPIYMNGIKIDLNDGDAVIYRGMEIEHWRDICKTSNKYYLGQLFLHYVEKNGPHQNEKYDKIIDREKIFEDLLWNKL